MLRYHVIYLRCAMMILTLVVVGLSLMACDKEPEPNRDYVAEHSAYFEEMIDSKARLAEVLHGVKDRASADAAAPESRKLVERIERLSLLDAALSREMSLALWEKCIALDKVNHLRARKAHENMLRQIFYLENANFYRSDKLSDALR